MKIYIVTEDLGDGDVGLRYFKSSEAAIKYQEYMNKHYDYCCWHESNPHKIDTDSFKETEIPGEENEV